MVQCDWVVVQVDDLRLGRDALRDLVGGQPGADVQELPYPGLAGQVAHRADLELPALPGQLEDARQAYSLRKCYGCSMSEEIASRELRNDTAGVLRRVQEGQRLTITVNGKPVAELVPLQRAGRRPISFDELRERLPRIQADPGLRDDLAWLAGDTTDDLGPIQ